MKYILPLIIAATALTAAVISNLNAQENAPASPGDTASNQFTNSLVVAGGCFWCVESDFEKLEGVGDVISGYSGGASQNPTYRNHSGHLEVALIPFDPAIVTYRELVDYFFRHIDPTDADGQFCDRGHSYTTAVFFENDDERDAAQAAKDEAASLLEDEIVTPIRKRMKFWEAEDYHQDYYKKSPVRYRYYRNACGRDRRINALWKN